MSVRSLSRTLRCSIAAGALTFAVSSAAIAMPAAPDAGVAPPPTSGNVTSGTDVAAPDQQSPIPAQVRPVPQQAPTWARDPQPLTRPQPAAPSADAGFQWDDAGLGAGGALLVVLTGLGAVVALRRRDAIDPPLAA